MPTPLIFSSLELVYPTPSECAYTSVRSYSSFLLATSEITPLRRLSCLLTARFLLHLRAWEHKRSGGRTTAIASALELDSLTHVATIITINEFGDDPVHIALQEQRTMNSYALEDQPTSTLNWTSG